VPRDGQVRILTRIAVWLDEVRPARAPLIYFNSRHEFGSSVHDMQGGLVPEHGTAWILFLGNCMELCHLQCSVSLL
jgi:hypothetical protein